MPKAVVHDHSRTAPDQSFLDGLVSLSPNLKAFAMGLCCDFHRAEDLVQQTMVKALANHDSYAGGTNQRAWLFTILRNTFLSDMRRAGREVTLDEQAEPPVGNAMAQQEAWVELREVSTMIDDLPDVQQQALMLVGVEGCSYEEAARRCGCALGTIKSRVNRARVTLVAASGERPS